MMTPRENFIHFLRKEPYEYTPTSDDLLNFAPEEICDNVARGLVWQQEPYTGKFGGRDLFGVEWVYQEQARGSMEAGHLFDVDDIENWRDFVVFPDLDKIDWEGAARRNADMLKTDKLIHTIVYTGFLERLYSFVGVEDAACALVDEDLQEYVSEIFGALADFYIEYIRRLHKYFNVGLVELHDDWGTQKTTFMSPATHAELIAPYIRRVVEGIHEFGVLYEQHSCGMIGSLLPNMIDAKIDTWMGQQCNDKLALVQQYGDRFRFAVCLWPGEELSSAEKLDFCRDYVDKYHGRDVWIHLGFVLNPEEKAVMQEYIRSKVKI